MSEEVHTVRMERVFNAPIDLVYRAWTEPEHVNRWMKCDAKATLKVEGWEPRVGAETRCEMAMPGEWQTVSTGRVIEADPPRLFAYVVDPNPQIGAPEFIVRVELSEVEGGTHLVLTHSGLPNHLCPIIEGGWGTSLGLLGELLETLAPAGEVR